MWLEGFREVLAGENLLWLGVGSLIGMFVGVLPALGPAFGIALLMGFTFGMDPAVALVFLCAIQASCVYGDSVTSILINVPGSVATVASSWDGYPLTQQGKGGMALGVAAVSTLVGALISWLSLAALARPITRFALMVGAPEYFALGVMATSLISLASRGQTLKGLIMAVAGLALSCIGEDPITGVNFRFSFGMQALEAGIPIVICVLGAFALSEVFDLLASGGTIAQVSAVRDSPFKGVAEALRRPLTLLRAGLVGWFVGILPALGTSLAGVSSYFVEKQYSKENARFGHGAVAGLVAAEVGKGACAVGDLIPTFTLGVPGSVVGALLMAALMIHGVQPGPRFLLSGVMPYTVFAGILLGLVVGAVVLMLGGRWMARVAWVPTAILAPVVVVLTFFGAYADRNYFSDLFVLTAIGLFAHVAKRLGYSVVPLVLGFILGPILEANFHRSLGISFGQYAIFVQRPIALAVLLATGVFMGWDYLADLVRRLRGRRASELEAHAEGEQGRKELGVERAGEGFFLSLLLALLIGFALGGYAYSPRVRLFPSVVSGCGIVLVGYRLVSLTRGWVRRKLNSSHKRGFGTSTGGLGWEWTAVLVFLYAFLVPVFGFVMASGVFVLATGYLGGYRKFGVLLSVTLAVAGAVWTVARILHVMLPGGLLFGGG